MRGFVGTLARCLRNRKWLSKCTKTSVTGRRGKYDYNACGKV